MAVKPRRMAISAAVWSASYLSALSQLLPNIQPLVLGSFADKFHLEAGLLGQMNSTFIAAGLVSALTAPAWVHRSNWSLLNLAALAATFVSFVLGMWATSPVTLLALYGSLGLFLGTLFPISFAALGEDDDPTRAFAISVTAQNSLSALASFSLSQFVIPRWGPGGILVFFGVLTLIGFIAAHRAPRRMSAVSHAGSAIEERRAIAWREAMPVSAALLAIFLFMGGVLGYWTFLERIGVMHGISPQAIGLTVSVCALGAIASSALVAWIGDRFAASKIVYLGSAGVLLAFVLILPQGMLTFVLSNLLFALGWGLVLPAYWTVIRESDVTERLFSATPAASGIGAVLAGLVAGPIISLSGFTGLLMMDAAAVSLGAVIVFVISLHAKKATPPRII